MIKAIKNFFGIYTEAERFENGRRYVDDQIAEHGKESDKAREMWVYADCPFDKTEFDRGIVSRLIELGVEQPVEYEML